MLGRVKAVLGLLLLVLVAGCSPDDDPPAAAPSGSAPASTATAASRSPAPSTSADADAALPPVTDPVSLPALMAKRYDGRALRTRDVLARTAAYTRYAVTYRSAGRLVSGVMNVPRGHPNHGPFPVAVLLHGYIDPDVYVTGQGMMREQAYLAEHGYVALHVDYRGHAGSEPAPRAEEQLRLGYTVDAVNAVLAVRASGMRRLDGDRVGLVGRSMGGGVLLNVLVAQPGLVDAAVAFAPVSSDTVDNFERWTRPEHGDVARRILALHGEPADNPQFWRGVSPRTYVDRITEPLLIHHGTSDDSCPIRWTRATMRALRAADRNARLYVYPGEEHAFGPQFTLSMRRTVRFLDRHLTA